MRWMVLVAVALAAAGCRGEPRADRSSDPRTTAAAPPTTDATASVGPVAPRAPATAARVELRSAPIAEVLPMLEALSGEPVIVDPDAEPIVRCGVIDLHSDANVPSQAAISALQAQLEASGLVVIDTKKGIVLQRRAGSPAPACP